MSKQAFEKVMSQLPEEDKKNIYAAVSYTHLRAHET